HDVLTQYWSWMLVGTSWVSCHVDRSIAGHSALQLHFTSDGGCARRTTCGTGKTSRLHGTPAGDAYDYRQSDYENEVLCFHTNLPSAPVVCGLFSTLKFAGTLLVPNQVSLRKGVRGSCHIPINDSSFSCHFLVKRCSVKMTNVLQFHDSCSSRSGIKK